MSIEARVLTRSDRELATWGLMLATAMQAADALIANVALPQLEQDLGGGVELGAWVITSYLCATAVMAPLTGWLRRRYGARRLFFGSVGAFIAASLLCALAPSAAAMIVFRVLQGAGAGVISPLAQAILLDIYPRERHGRMLAIWGATLMAGPVLAPPLGGIITDLVSWRGVFVVNLPLGLIVIALLRPLRYRAEISDDRAIDGISVLLLMIAVGGLQLCLGRGVGRSWLASPELLGEGAATILALTALVIRIQRSGFFIFRPDIFKDLNFSVAAGYTFLAAGMLFVVVVFLPSLGQNPLGYSATLAGFTIVPRAVFMTLTILVMGRLIGRLDHRVLLSGGWFLTAVGLALLSHIEPPQELAWIIIGSSVQAVGAGILFTQHMTLAFSTLVPTLRTDASGLYSLLRQLGFAFGVAVMTAVLRVEAATNLVALSNGDSGLGALPRAQVLDMATFDAYRDCFRIMAVASLIVIPGIFLFRRPPEDSERDDSAFIG
jgi:MFS transporter, DHA2 family, multidrug resistance protein